MGAVALVLVIVTANILSLLLSRSIARRHEKSLRSALGAWARAFCVNCWLRTPSYVSPGALLESSWRGWPLHSHAP